MGAPCYGGLLCPCGRGCVRQVGGFNQWASSVSAGACGSQLNRLQIPINSTRAKRLIEPFMQATHGSKCPVETPELAGIRLPGDARLPCDAMTDRSACNAEVGVVVLVCVSQRCAVVWLVVRLWLLGPFASGALSGRLQVL